MPETGLSLRGRVAFTAPGEGANLRQGPRVRPPAGDQPTNPMARHSPAKAKYSPKAQKKIEQVMEEHHEGTLRMGKTGKVVPKNRPDIARAIALSEARRAGLKVPKRRT